MNNPYDDIADKALQELDQYLSIIPSEVLKEMEKRNIKNIANLKDLYSGPVDQVDEEE